MFLPIKISPFTPSLFHSSLETLKERVRRPFATIAVTTKNLQVVPRIATTTGYRNLVINLKVKSSLVTARAVVPVPRNVVLNHFLPHVYRRNGALIFFVNYRLGKLVG